MIPCEKGDKTECFSYLHRNDQSQLKDSAMSRNVPFGGEGFYDQFQHQGNKCHSFLFWKVNSFELWEKMINVSCCLEVLSNYEHSTHTVPNTSLWRKKNQQTIYTEASDKNTSLEYSCKPGLLPYISGFILDSTKQFPMLRL